MNSLVIHYKELALKGRNRPWFVHMLVRHLRAVLTGTGIRAVSAVTGRIEVDGSAATDWGEVERRVGRVCGIANYSRGGRGTQDLAELADAILVDLRGAEPASFRVSVRRTDKRFPLTSPQIEREVGGLIKQARGWHVDLDRPALTIHVEMLGSHAFYFFGKQPGVGGMPTGTGGRVACLLSGGIDSPVAAFRMIRRGCTALFIHFHSYPILDSTSQEKVRELVAVLTRYQLRSRLLLVPFADAQKQVLLAVSPELRVVIYRRLMLRIAERLARQARARALVTGEAIAQVASQTLENLTLIGEATSMQVLRPLISMDKDEIADEARRIGTLAISNISDQDCCQLFTPRHPATRAKHEDVLAAEAALTIDELVDAAVAGTTAEEFRFPPGVA